MEELKKGFDFVVQHSLSVKEIEVLSDFMGNPFSSTNLAIHRNTKLSATHAIITKLKLKGLIIESGQDGQHKVYKINI